MKFFKFTCLFGLSLSVLLALLPLSALATNILANSGLNDPYLDIPGRTWNGQAEKIASGWQPFYIAAGTYDASNNAKKLHWMSSVQFALSFGGIDYHIEGNRAQNMWSSYEFDAGIYQQISGVTPGQGYGFDMPIVTYWRGPGYPDSDGKMFKQVGIDPTGGTNPTSSNIIWSSTNANDKTWVYMDVAATAQASTITVFARVQAPENDSFNHVDLDMVYFDAAHVAPVPATTLAAAINGTAVTLNWSGSGVAPAWSLKGYEVQYRDQASSTWTTIQSKNSTNTSGGFTGQLGRTYLVRARTWQQINESYQSGIDMPGDWREQTVTLGALVNGRVTTNRGDGVSGVTVSEAGSGASTTTGGDGSFSLGLSGAGNYTFTVGAVGGWSAPPPVQASLQLTSTPFLSFTLRPPDNVVGNGDFENDLAGWQVSGAPPATVANGRRSGSASLRLDDTSSISQSGLISNSYQPVLSFWYKVEGGDGNDSFTAHLFGSDGVTPANSFSTAANSDWQQVWLPLNLAEVYTGPASVEFSLAQGGEPQAAVYLDEVSLGASWGGPNDTYLPVIFK
ncbi:MAG: hypothetical protein HS126_04715 [Anaerolineales bacterium]|nr:hypothetical protein [Anaerolineales bacterium]